MRVIECLQGSPEWFSARCGIATASGFSKIITSTGKPSTSQAAYLNDCLAEYVVGEHIETYKNEWMQRGNDLEAEAREQYEYISGNNVEQVGFCLHDDGIAGCSPDGLVGTDGLIEIKAPKESTMISYYLGGFPTTYKQQVNGQMWITGRKWCDFHAYHPNMKPFMVRIDRDEKYISMMEAEIRKFNDKLNELKCKLEAWKL